MFSSKLCIPPAKKKDSNDDSTASLDSNENVKVKSETTENKTENSVCSEKENSTSDSNKIRPDEAKSEQSAVENGLEQSDACNDKSLDVAKLENCDNTNNSETKDSKMDVSDQLEQVNISEAGINNANDKIVSDTPKDKDSDSAPRDLERDILTEEELVELHLKADILHYLLPGLCHLTAEEEPRRLLVESGALGVLDLYMWRQWEKLVDETRKTRETMVSVYTVKTEVDSHLY